MKSIFIITDKDELISRINSLTPASRAEWGKMNVSQMLVHCRFIVENAIGERYVKRTLMGKLIGGFFKSMAVSDKPFGKGSPTHTDFVIVDTEEFESEKKQLAEAVERMYDGGKGGVTGEPHAFFGHLSPTEWGVLMYKHLDHHLRQFGA